MLWSYVPVLTLLLLIAMVAGRSANHPHLNAMARQFNSESDDLERDLMALRGTHDTHGTHGTHNTQDTQDTQNQYQALLDKLRNLLSQHTADNTENEESQEIGTVKRFNDAKGFGFIAREDDGSDVFVPESEINVPGAKTLKEGQKVTYHLEVGKKGLSATNVQLLKDQ